MLHGPGSAGVFPTGDPRYIAGWFRMEHPVKNIEVPPIYGIDGTILMIYRKPIYIDDVWRYPKFEETSINWLTVGFIIIGGISIVKIDISTYHHYPMDLEVPPNFRTPPLICVKHGATSKCAMNSKSGIHVLVELTCS